MADDPTQFQEFAADDNDDVPWADPAIRVGYEAALGRLILGFNELDYYLTQLIDHCLDLRERPLELEHMTKGSFTARLNHLRTLNNRFPELKLRDLQFEELVALNELRNVVAHGHFDQNPFQGDYALIGKTHRDDFPAKRLDEITARLEEAANVIKVQIWFSDLEDLS